MNTDLLRPCGECPFRRVSARGWLGPWKPTELLFHLGRGEFACHRTIPRDEEVAADDPRLQACAGAAIFLNNKIEESRHPAVAAHQAKMRRIVSPALASTVFQWSHEFLEHHEGGLLSLETVVGSDGRIIHQKLASGTCRRCGENFTFVMTTRPVQRCRRCRSIVEEEWRVANLKRLQAKRRELKENPPDNQPRRKIRYAGFDPTENHGE